MTTHGSYIRPFKGRLLGWVHRVCRYVHHPLQQGALGAADMGCGLQPKARPWGKQHSLFQLKVLQVLAAMRELCL